MVSKCKFLNISLDLNLGMQLKVVIKKSSGIHLKSWSSVNFVNNYLTRYKYKSKSILITIKRCICFNYYEFTGNCCIVDYISVQLCWHHRCCCRGVSSACQGSACLLRGVVGMPPQSVPASGTEKGGRLLCCNSFIWPAGLWNDAVMLQGLLL